MIDKIQNIFAGYNYNPLMHKFLGFPLWIYLTSTLSIVVCFYLIRMIQKIFINKLGRKEPVSAPVKYFKLIILNISSFTIFILSFYIVLQFFPLPTQITSIIHKLTAFVLFLQIGQLIEVLLNPNLSLWLENSKNVPRSAHSLIMIFTRFFVWMVLGLVLLDNLGINVTTLVAGLGIGGVAVALAVQNILGDLFCSFSIVLDRPFEVGDFIVVGELKGEVEKIGIKSTRIRSLSGEQIVISNTELTQGRIQNFKRMNQRRIVFKIGVVYDTPSEKLRIIPEIIKTSIESIEGTRFDRSHFLEFGNSSLNFETVFFVLSSDYNIYADIHHKLNISLVEKFSAEKIDFAFPTRTIYHQNLQELNLTTPAKT